MDGTASLANREISRVLPANCRKVPFSGAAKHLNEAETARYFGQLNGESPETWTRWRSGVDSNSRFRWFWPDNGRFLSVSFLRAVNPIAMNADKRNRKGTHSSRARSSDRGVVLLTLLAEVTRNYVEFCSFQRQLDVMRSRPE
jgi:hypothetical protein